jgi:carbon storage regulator CsrA
MLVLSRKRDEEIYVGNNITITIVRIKGNAVQVGIDAPPDVKVLRSELAWRPEGNDQRTSQPRVRTAELMAAYQQD